MGFENLDVEAMAERAGGRTMSTTLVQKRIRELERGWPSLAETPGRDIIQVAIQEFREEKIWLVSGEEADELREKRQVEERERARALEAARRAAELEAGNAPTVPRAGIGGALGLGGR
jgi:DNA-directed RNA polymerase subunit K/omega